MRACRLSQLGARAVVGNHRLPGSRDRVQRQRVDLHDALRGYPINGAYQLRLDDKAGSLEVGKHADLTMLARNLVGGGWSPPNG